MKVQTMKMIVGLVAAFAASLWVTAASALTLPKTMGDQMTLVYEYTPTTETDTAVLGKLDYRVGLCVILR